MKSMPRSNGMGEGVNNGVATNIRSRNHINTTPMLRTDLTRACVQSLGMGMGRC